MIVGSELKKRFSIGLVSQFKAKQLEYQFQAITAC